MSEPHTSSQASQNRTQGASAPLGIYTNKVSLCSPSNGSNKPDEAFSRAESLVTRYVLQAAAKELLPRERVGICLRLPRAQHVEVWKNPHGAHYGGLCVCGSIWQCPMCAAKVSERRRVELSEAVKRWMVGDDQAQRPGGHVLLVTFTLRHKAGQSYKMLVDTLNEAYKQVQQGAGWKGIKQRHGIVGTVRAFEPTHGRNGWHPHLHVLFFVAPGIDLGKFTFDIKARWLRVVERLGGDATWEHGVDVQSASSEIADYVAKFGREPKWTVAHEVAKAPSKRGRVGGRTPIELLYDYAFKQDKKAGELWRLYAMTMSGRRQLTWSRGLRELLGMRDEQTDEEVATEREEQATLFATLTLQQWRVVLANDCRAEILNIAATGDHTAFYEFLVQIGAADRLELPEADEPIEAKAAGPNVSGRLNLDRLALLENPQGNGKDTRIDRERLWELQWSEGRFTG